MVHIVYSHHLPSCGVVTYVFKTGVHQEGASVGQFIYCVASRNRADVDNHPVVDCSNTKPQVMLHRNQDGLPLCRFMSCLRHPPRDSPFDTRCDRNGCQTIDPRRTRSTGAQYLFSVEPLPRESTVVVACKLPTGVLIPPCAPTMLKL